MSRKKLFFGVFIIIVFAICAWWAWTRGIGGRSIGELKENASAVRNEIKNTEVQKGLAAMLRKEFHFWGKVQDENGNAVPNARIEYSINSDTERSLRGVLLGDGSGRFELSGNGAVVMISASKEGYHQIRNRSGLAPSERKFNIAPEFGPVRNTSLEDPASFTLLKKQNPTPLERVDLSKSIMASGENALFEIGEEGGVINFQCWRDAGSTDEIGKPYPWKCRISVPGGGLSEDKNRYEFVAPQDNYDSEWVVEMPVVDGAEKWSRSVAKKMWVKLSDGTFARLEVGVYMGPKNLGSVIGVRNPKPGDRNFEP